MNFENRFLEPISLHCPAGVFAVQVQENQSPRIAPSMRETALDERPNSVSVEDIPVISHHHFNSASTFGTFCHFDCSLSTTSSKVIEARIALHSAAPCHCIHTFVSQGMPGQCPRTCDYLLWDFCFVFQAIFELGIVRETWTRGKWWWNRKSELKCLVVSVTKVLYEYSAGTLDFLDLSSFPMSFRTF